jgi:hypothetical protein
LNAAENSSRGASGHREGIVDGAGSRQQIVDLDGAETQLHHFKPAHVRRRIIDEIVDIPDILPERRDGSSASRC